MNAHESIHSIYTFIWICLKTSGCQHTKRMIIQPLFTWSGSTFLQKRVSLLQWILHALSSDLSYLNLMCSNPTRNKYDFESRSGLVCENTHRGIYRCYIAKQAYTNKQIQHHSTPAINNLSAYAPWWFLIFPRETTIGPHSYLTLSYCVFVMLAYGSSFSHWPNSRRLIVIIFLYILQDRNAVLRHQKWKKETENGFTAQKEMYFSTNIDMLFDRWKNDCILSRIQPYKRLLLKTISIHSTCLKHQH